MTPPKIQYDYKEIEEMIKVLQKASRDLDAVSSEMTRAAQVIEQGALLGTAGDEFRTALQSTLTAAIDRLRTRIDEEARYVARELAQMQKVEKQTSRVRYQNN